jgi:predicted GNAT superfamily acetyltransferase
MPEIEVRDARGADLVAGCALLARALGFSERDALPPWLVQTLAAEGGLALGAFAADALVGFSCAVPTAAGELFSCGLAVARDWRGRGVARRLKLAQRERALRRGVLTIRWTADPLAAPALALYLGRLRARLVAYAPDLYTAVRPASAPADDVLVEWSLAGPPPTPGAPVGRAAIPLDRRALDAPALARWRRDAREAMTGALARGGVGTDVVLDRAGGRAHVVFRAAA